MIRRFFTEMAFIDIDDRHCSQRIDFRGNTRHRGTYNRRHNQSNDTGGQIAGNESQKNVVRVVELARVSRFGQVNRISSGGLKLSLGTLILLRLDWSRMNAPGISLR